MPETGLKRSEMRLHKYFRLGQTSRDTDSTRIENKHSAIAVETPGK